MKKPDKMRLVANCNTHEEAVELMCIAFIVKVGIFIREMNKNGKRNRR